MKKVLGCIRRADRDYQLIEPGDHVLVGVSGGKDSLLLLRALRLYQYFSPHPFTLSAATLTLGLTPVDLSPIRALCQELGVAYHVRETEIGKIVFEERREKNPCALCANMRRGALNDLANEIGANKVALGHHRDDVIETFLLSLLFEGRLHTFSAKTYLCRSGVTVIRPMVYLPESHAIHVAKQLALPVVKSPCPANKLTRREDMKALSRHLCTLMPQAKERILSAIAGGGLLDPSGFEDLKKTTEETNCSTPR